MHIELPENPVLLTQQAQRRADRDTPEVIRFSKGTFIIERSMAEPCATRTGAFLLP